jgi:hypothetical protein
VMTWEEAQPEPHLMWLYITTVRRLASS